MSPYYQFAKVWNSHIKRLLLMPYLLGLFSLPFLKLYFEQFTNPFGELLFYIIYTVGWITLVVLFVRLRNKSIEFWIRNSK